MALTPVKGVRWTPEDLAKIADLRQWTGLRTRAEVLRYCLDGVHAGFVVALQEGDLELAELPGDPESPTSPPPGSNGNTPESPIPGEEIEPSRTHEGAPP
jgi:hypothetical protein